MLESLGPITTIYGSVEIHWFDPQYHFNRFLAGQGNSDFISTEKVPDSYTEQPSTLEMSV